VIQAGGESTRMGANKALMPFLGRPLIERVIEQLQPVAGKRFVVTNEPESFAFLDLPLYPDLLPGFGALGGLYTALARADTPWVGMVACDMPFASARLLEAEFALLEEGDADVVIPHSGEGYEPFHAVFRREACLSAVKTALEQGQRRMISWLPVVKVLTMGVDELRRYDPDLLAFQNVNTPEEFAAAEQLARSLTAGNVHYSPDPG